ncbi:ATP-binding cassette domain-containing protein [Cellulomonas cellasea]|uniref:ABC transporter ATP-binding protein n=1 Tax=Cellulomonas cellasea TaxID=43670 RepID=UPI0025A4B1D9|nr:ATP-binding cassette domain-containing protein [Cellulomonas cellasea]MDM8084230.1 ATP-binding cassette domain-containing protein [Cellulomonas cellasea]
MTGGTRQPAVPAIEAKALSFRYPGADTDTLRDVDLRIERGDFVAVVGGNGSGKTTLCKTFNGLVPHYWSGEFAGEVRVGGVDTWESSVAQLSSSVGYVYQDFQNQLVRPTVRDEVAFGPINFGLADHAERTAEALRMVGIAHLADRFVWQLSGGQAHLVALASVLALRPEVVVVDEPVAELDPAAAVEIYERLTDLNRQHGITVITIEHHAEFVARYAKSVLLMSQGAPVWHLPTAEALGRADELAEHGVPAPQIVAGLHRIGVSGVPLSVARAAELVRAEQHAGFVRPVEVATPVADAGAALPEPRAVAVARGVSHGYRDVGGGLHPVIDDLSVTLREGDRVALVGGNGAGKTTLMRLLAGIHVPRGGTVELDGVDTRKQRAGRLAERAAYLAQRPERMFLKASIREDVALFPAGRRAPDVDALVDRILARVRLTEHADRDGRTLSGGQQRRATLAIGLAMRPALLLLDEPTASLDVSSRDDVIAMLADLADDIACTVVATHDMHLVAEWANRVLVLDAGRVIADTTPRELFAEPGVLAPAHLVPPQITQLGLALGLDPLPLTVEEFAAHYAPAPVGALT